MTPAWLQTERLLSSVEIWKLCSFERLYFPLLALLLSNIKSRILHVYAKMLNYFNSNAVVRFVDSWVLYCKTTFVLYLLTFFLFLLVQPLLSSLVQTLARLIAYVDYLSSRQLFLPVIFQALTRLGLKWFCEVLVCIICKQSWFRTWINKIPRSLFKIPCSWLNYPFCHVCCRHDLTLVFYNSMYNMKISITLTWDPSY